MFVGEEQRERLCPGLPDTRRPYLLVAGHPQQVAFSVTMLGEERENCSWTFHSFPVQLTHVYSHFPDQD